ncbi:hypothetical protein ACFQX7_00040 [Luedemannella flava]
MGEWLPPTGTADSALAWSPDGRLMAVQTNMGIRFVDMTGSGGTVPNSLRYDSSVLGWRSPTSIVVEGSDDDADTDTLVEVSVVDGHRTVLSRFPTTRSCEYGQHRCRPYRIQLATNLIADATIRPSAPDRGPWVPVVHAATTLGAGALGVGLVLLILRRRRRRRAARWARPVADLVHLTRRATRGASSGRASPRAATAAPAGAACTACRCCRRSP